DWSSDVCSADLIEHTSRLCEPNCGYLPLCLYTNAVNDHFFRNSWIPVSVKVLYQNKTLCNYSIFCRWLDTLFKTVNFQFKTRHNLDHCRWKDAVFSQTNEIIHLK